MGNQSCKNYCYQIIIRIKTIIIIIEKYGHVIIVFIHFQTHSLPHVLMDRDSIEDWRPTALIGKCFRDPHKFLG